MKPKTKRIIPKNVDEYISAFPPEVQTRLKKIRKIIRSIAPTSEEVISYDIPGYKYYGMLFYFAAFTNHISIYPAPRQHAAFKKELALYKGGKGTVQFPHDKPIPFDLIKRIIKFRKQQNEEKNAVKAKNNFSK